jgi:hypothetical protein
MITKCFRAPARSAALLLRAVVDASSLTIHLHYCMAEMHGRAQNARGSRGKRILHRKIVFREWHRGGKRSQHVTTKPVGTTGRETFGFQNSKNLERGAVLQPTSQNIAPK